MEPADPTWHGATGVFLRNIPAKCGHEELCAFFESCGVRDFDLKLATHRNGKCRGYARVLFRDTGSSIDFVSKVHLQHVPGFGKPEPLTCEPLFPAAPAAPAAQEARDRGVAALTPQVPQIPVPVGHNMHNVRSSQGSQGQGGPQSAQPAPAQQSASSSWACTRMNQVGEQPHGSGQCACAPNRLADIAPWQSRPEVYQRSFASSSRGDGPVHFAGETAGSTAPPVAGMVGLGQQHPNSYWHRPAWRGSCHPCGGGSSQDARLLAGSVPAFPATSGRSHEQGIHHWHGSSHQSAGSSTSSTGPLRVRQEACYTAPPPSTFGNQEQGYGQQALALPTGHAQISPIGEQREWPQPFGENVSLPCSRPPQPHEPGQMQWVMLCCPPPRATPRATTSRPVGTDSTEVFP
jgi:hypothetical protein